MTEVARLVPKAASRSRMGLQKERSRKQGGKQKYSNKWMRCLVRKAKEVSCNIRLNTIEQFHTAHT